MKAPKLMIADIDDTLMSKGNPMSELTRAVFNAAHDKGIWICVASGRPLDEVDTSIQEFNLAFVPDFVIGMNGGEVQDNIDKEIFTQFQLDEAMLERIVEMMDDQPCNISMYKNGMLYTKEFDDMVAASSVRAGKEVHIIEDLKEVYDAPNGKIMFRTDTSKTCDNVAAYANSHHIPGISFFKTQPNLLEVCDIRVNKGTGLKEICRRHNLDLADVIAFGDASNDNEMLIDAGVGVCLANGLPDTKEIADYITEKTCADDGLPLWVIENVEGFEELHPAA